MKSSLANLDCTSKAKIVLLSWRLCKDCWRDRAHDHSPFQRLHDHRSRLELAGSKACVLATADGVFEPIYENGREVCAGEPAGRMHFTLDLAPMDPLRPPPSR